MNKFINTKKEKFLGDQYFKDHILKYCKEFDYRTHKKELSPYYEKKDFMVSMMYSDFYSTHSGVASDEYISTDLFYFYIIPALNRYDFINAYVDKNIYSKLFPNENQPATIIKNINGIFYDNNNQEINYETSINLSKQITDNCILKPTVETCDGIGVCLLPKDEKEIRKLYESYKINFIVQKKIQQCKELSLLNCSSLNTLRIFTYRNIKKDIVVLPYTFVRFGSEGSIKDNASGGGGFCHINNSGIVEDTIFYFHKFEHGSLKQSKAIEKLEIPNFQNALDFAVKLHQYLPYFDYVGWDISIDSDYKPVFIEFNLLAGCEAPQMSSGPFFGNYRQEIIERASKVIKEQSPYMKIKFENGSYKLINLL